MGDSTLFVVRVWRRNESFRAGVRRVDDEHTHVFDTAAEVARYLEASTRASGELPRAAAGGAASPGANTGSR